MDPSFVHLVCDSLECNGDWQVKNDKSPFSIRIKKMAFLRNKYVEYITKNFKEMDYDFDISGMKQLKKEAKGKDNISIINFLMNEIDNLKRENLDVLTSTFTDKERLIGLFLFG